MRNRLLIIDDDTISNMLTQLVIEQEFPNTDVIVFEDPQKGLEYMEQLALDSAAPLKKHVLLLDINMPGLSGWEILERLAAHAGKIKERIKIFMLSSSVDETDRLKAANNELVSGFFVKPLISNNFRHLLWE